MPGIDQKVQIEDAKISQKTYKTKSSSLANHMLQLWGQGKLSATALQLLAKAGIEDGCETVDLMELAALGSWGQYPGNTHRDLVRLLTKKISHGKHGGLKESPLHTIKVPAFCSKEDMTQGTVLVDFTFFLPHLWISALFESYPAHARELFGIDQLQQFWRSIKENDPRLIGSPVDWKKARKGKHLYIPLWLHGDGVEFSADSLLTFSFGPCLYSTLQSGEGRGLKQSHVIDHAYCLAAFPKSAQVEDT